MLIDASLEPTMPKSRARKQSMTGPKWASNNSNPEGDAPENQGKTGRSKQVRRNTGVVAAMMAREKARGLEY